MTPHRVSPPLTTLHQDPYLRPFLPKIHWRAEKARKTESHLTQGLVSLTDFASGHEYFGLHRRGESWVFTEWAPHATAVYFVGEFSDWRDSERYALHRLNEQGVWRITLAGTALKHGDLYRLRVHWNGGSGDRIPAYARRVVQDQHTKIFNAQVWAPASPHIWRHPDFRRSDGAAPLIYEAHVGMAQDCPSIGTYDEFRARVLPRIVDAGYNTIQLMAIQEHPYYGSFGYHVSNYFAASSRFGTPEELKSLVDAIHEAGLAVIIDLIHSHAVSNEVEGLARFDGTTYQYFHKGDRGHHAAWGSRCFDYSKPEVLHFLLSNCRFWLDEYRVDGFRFDGVTSMLYLHHGLGPAFTSYDLYFDDTVDEDALAYLTLANKLIHTLRPDAMTIAEDVSGMPGLAAPAAHLGAGFDYRLAMGVPDAWFKLAADARDDDWSMEYIWRELTNRRGDERTISYVECHDQALVGGKTMIFQLIDAAMYDSMQVTDRNAVTERGMALHMMMRLATLGTAGHGYLNFIGNEFGHPEWVDFPREGNNWSYHYARRQWSLRDDPRLKYHFLADFDKAMIGIAGAQRILAGSQPKLLWIREDDKILAFERSPLVFLFNFHPSKSVVDYAIDLSSGAYRLEMNSDEGRFGGHNRIQPNQRFVTQTTTDGNIPRHRLRVYLPCRTAMVLRKTG